MSARYVCKSCGAESPAGIGYVSTLVGPLPAPAGGPGDPGGCRQRHELPIGAWCPLTRGFWEGGEYVTADTLGAGDVFRLGTYTGYAVVADPVLTPACGDWRPETLRVRTLHGEQILSPDQTIERMPR